ncbi:hypothetical protein IAU60_002518 [Kwoniella sp. DSM 27419]
MIPRVLPVINFALATGSIGIQLGLLLPWHDTLSEEIKVLKAEQTRQMAEYHHEKRLLLSALDNKVHDLTMRLPPSAS